MTIASSKIVLEPVANAVSVTEFNDDENDDDDDDDDDDCFFLAECYSCSHVANPANCTNHAVCEPGEVILDDLMIISICYFCTMYFS